MGKIAKNIFLMLGVVFSFCPGVWADSEIERLFEASLQGKNPEENREMLSRIIDLAPDSAHGHFSKGWFFAQEGNYQKAIPEYKMALDIRPTFGEARHNLATAYFQIARWEDAILEYREVLRQHPGWSDTRLNLGSAYFMAGRSIASLHEWEKALELDATLVVAHYYLGLVCDNLDRPSEARHHYLHFLESDKNEDEYAQYINQAVRRQSEIWIAEGRKKT